MNLIFEVQDLAVASPQIPLTCLPQEMSTSSSASPSLINPHPLPQGLMNLIFEVQDLAVASPATVSRCGMVYLQPSLLGWQPLVLSWLGSLPTGALTPALQERVLGLLRWLLPPLLRLVAVGCKQAVAMQGLNLVASLCRLTHSLLDPLLKPQGGAGAQVAGRPTAAATSPAIIARPEVGRLVGWIDEGVGGRVEKQFLSTKTPSVPGCLFVCQGLRRRTPAVFIPAIPSPPILQCALVEVEVALLLLLLPANSHPSSC